MDNDIRSAGFKNVEPPKPETKPEPEVFHTPETTAAQDDLTEPVKLTDPVGESETSSNTKFKKLKNFWHEHWPPGKVEWIVIVVVVLVLGGGLTWLLTMSKPVPPKPKAIVTKPVVVAPTTVPSTLSGLPVAPSVNKLPVTGVMIENSEDARPQSGLGQASVVFEAMAEGGVTRFLALYQDTSPSNVGPIRSARPYYIAWDLGFDAAYAHVGGSPDGLADIKSWNVKDLDEFYNGSSYHRISSREAPHNVYTGISTLNQLESQKGYGTSNFTGFVRKAAAPAKKPTATSISLTLSGPLYNAAYTYNTAYNSYNRSEAGSAMIDANTNAQISPKVVIAMVVPESQGALDATGAYYSDYNVIGSGAVTIFQDGTATTGTWTKSSNTSQITFTDSSGQTIGLNPGQTWITAVTTASDISYSP